MTAWSEAFLAPLVARLGEQEAVIRGQAETIGRQTAELERAASTVLTLHDELVAAEASRRREHRRLRIGLAVAGALAVAAGLAPGWVR